MKNGRWRIPLIGNGSRDPSSDIFGMSALREIAVPVAAKYSGAD